MRNFHLLVQSSFEDGWLKALALTANPNISDKVLRILMVSILQLAGLVVYYFAIKKVSQPIPR